MSKDRYGTLIIFDTADALLDAVRALRRAGFFHLEAYAPYAVDGLSEALALRRNAITTIAFIAGAIGGLGTLGMEYYSGAINYPIRVGGRPFASWPAFLPPALEMIFLFAAIAGLLTMLAGSKLPRFYHPVFHASAFDRVMQDRFAIVVREDNDEQSDAAIRHALAGIALIEMKQVPR